MAERAVGKPHPGAEAGLEELGPCPSCGLRLIIVLHPSGVPEGVGHDEPMCDWFGQTSPLEILHTFIAANTKIEA